MNFYFYYLWSKIMSQTISFVGGVEFFPVSHYMVIFFLLIFFGHLKKSIWHSEWKPKYSKWFGRPYMTWPTITCLISSMVTPQLLHILLICQTCSYQAIAFCYFLCLEHSLLGIHVVSLSHSSNFHSCVTIIKSFLLSTFQHLIYIFTKPSHPNLRR